MTLSPVRSQTQHHFLVSSYSWCSNHLLMFECGKHFIFFLCKPHTLCFIWPTVIWLIFILFVCLFSVLCWLTGLRFACLLSCPQFESSQTVSRIMGIQIDKGKVNPLTHNHLSSPIIYHNKQADTLLTHNQTRFPFHGPNEGDSEWQRVGLIHQHCSGGCFRLL